MVLKLYAGSSVAGMTELPSPTELKIGNEIIWSENTGRAQSGANKAKMIGDVVAEKKTYSITWGILTSSQMAEVKSKLPAGFFYFGVGTTKPSSADKFYRGDIQSEIIEVASGHCHKNVTVSVIEQ